MRHLAYLRWGGRKFHRFGALIVKAWSLVVIDYALGVTCGASFAGLSGLEGQLIQNVYRDEAIWGLKIEHKIFKISSTKSRWRDAGGDLIIPLCTSNKSGSSVLHQLEMWEGGLIHPGL